MNAFRLAAGASILAARKALEEGAAGTIGGGFHHAFADHGEGLWDHGTRSHGALMLLARRCPSRSPSWSMEKS